jgi:hypothetical protein
LLGFKWPAGNQILQHYSVKKLHGDKRFYFMLADVVNRANVMLGWFRAEAAWASR